MTDDRSKNRLGRGLAALIGEMDQPVASPSEATAEPAPVSSDRTVAVESIRPNPLNPRRQFSTEDLDELAASIREHGIVQPILVRPAPDGSTTTWEIIAGERRWRGAQQAGLHTVPVVVREVDDRQALELAIIENVQRADLNPIEEATGYQQLIDDHAYTQADLGRVIGKSRSHVANTLRLLKLPDAVQAMLSNGDLSSGHARALITLDDPLALARRIVAEGLSVRDVEDLANAQNAASPSGQAAPGRTRTPKDANTAELEKRLSDRLGMAVTIDHKANGKGKITIRYASLEQFDLLESRLGS